MSDEIGTAQAVQLRHEVRELQYRLKQAHKQLGKQGETIHQLRCEVNSLRALTDPEDRHRMQLWLNGSAARDLREKIEEYAELIKRQRDRIDFLTVKLTDPERQRRYLEATHTVQAFKEGASS